MLTGREAVWSPMSSALSEGVQRLEITSRVTLGVLALASGVYTYLGVRELLNGNATIVFFAAVIYAVAVSVGIYAFWTFLMRFAPHVRDHSNALAAQSLLPDIQLASTRFARLAESERTGSLTGTAGSGTVVQLLTQMSNQLGGLAQEVTQNADRVKALYEDGG